MTADVAHAGWLGHIQPASLLATRRVGVRGSAHKLLRMQGLVEQLIRVREASPRREQRRSSRRVSLSRHSPACRAGTPLAFLTASTAARAAFDPNPATRDRGFVGGHLPGSGAQRFSASRRVAPTSTTRERCTAGRIAGTPFACSNGDFFMVEIGTVMTLARSSSRAHCMSGSLAATGPSSYLVLTAGPIPV